MDTIIYFTLGAACSFTIFYFGWLAGCWFVNRENEDLKYDYYGEREFHNDYYAGSCCKRDEYHNPPKAKKARNKKRKA